MLKKANWSRKGTKPPGKGIPRVTKIYVTFLLCKEEESLMSLPSTLKLVPLLDQEERELLWI